MIKTECLETKQKIETNLEPKYIHLYFLGNLDFKIVTRVQVTFLSKSMRLFLILEKKICN